MRCVFGKQEYAAAGVEVAPKKVKWRLVRMAGLHVVSQGKPRLRYALAAKQPSSQAAKQPSSQAAKQPSSQAAKQASRQAGKQAYPCSCAASLRVPKFCLTKQLREPLRIAAMAFKRNTCPMPVIPAQAGIHVATRHCHTLPHTAARAGCSKGKAKVARPILFKCFCARCVAFGSVAAWCFDLQGAVVEGVAGCACDFCCQLHGGFGG